MKLQVNIHLMGKKEKLNIMHMLDHIKYTCMHLGQTFITAAVPSLLLQIFNIFGGQQRRNKMSLLMIQA